MRVRRLQDAIAAAPAYGDASGVTSPKPPKALEQAHSDADADSDDDIDAKLSQARLPLEQLLARNRQMEQRAERALQSSLESRSLLREIEGLLRGAEARAAADSDDEAECDSGGRAAGGSMSARSSCSHRPGGSAPAGMLKPSLATRPAGMGRGGYHPVGVPSAEAAEVARRPSSGGARYGELSAARSEAGPSSEPAPTHGLSPAEAVKAMRLERCDALRAGLEPIRHSLGVYEEQIAEANEGSARLERAVREALSFSAADLQVR